MAQDKTVFEGDLNALPIPCLSIKAVFDQDDRIIDFSIDQANTAFFDLIGIPSEVLLGGNISQLLTQPGADGDDWIAFNRSVIEQQAARELIRFIPRFEKWLRIVAKPNGSCDIVTVVEDVTRQMEAEAELRSSREEFRSILSNIHDVIYSAKYPDFKVDFVSASALRTTGYPPEHFINQRENWLHMVLPEDMVLVERGERELRETGKTRLEYRFRHADGSIRTVLEKAHILFD